VQLSHTRGYFLCDSKGSDIHNDSSSRYAKRSRLVVRKGLAPGLASYSKGRYDGAQRECTNAPRREVVAQVAKKMSFDLEQNCSWQQHVDAEAIPYEPKSSFERLALKRRASNETQEEPQKLSSLMKFLTRRGG
jgi:hypothetical protein